MVCPIAGHDEVIAFLTVSVVDRIINHLKLTFVADRPPPLTWSIRKSDAAETGGEYFRDFLPAEEMSG